MSLIKLKVSSNRYNRFNLVEPQDKGAEMPFTHARMRRERRTIEVLSQIYCHDLHATPRGQLCPDCRELKRIRDPAVGSLRISGE